MLIKIHSNIIVASCLISIFINCTPKQNSGNNANVLAVHLIPSSINTSQGKSLEPADIINLITSLENSGSSSQKIHVLSDINLTIAEQDNKESLMQLYGFDLLGYGKSKFIANSPWATIRYLGNNPAGAGLTGEAQNNAQIAALGTENDSIPIVTAAWTITHIMEEFFVPLLDTLPKGKEILKNFKIQGVYYSPFYQQPNEQQEFDNAYLIGLQILQLLPSSCFQNSTGINCKKPYMTTGHDPTIIAHETAHAIYNHLRGSQILTGFQWTAVNEGYADYFAASFFADPVLGKIWKVGNANNTYLRKLTTKPTTEDANIAIEEHQFGVVWGSTLWRLRERLLKEQNAILFEVNRVLLYAIVFLGETEKIQFGDAATALLKSAEALDHVNWKQIMREEFDIAKIALANNSFLSPHNALKSDNIKTAGASTPSKQASKGAFCGLANNSYYTWWIMFFPLIIPLFFIKKYKKQIK